MDDPDRWARRLADAAPEPLRICELCVQELGMTGAGISSVTASGNRGVVCSTDDASARIEDLQLTLGEGPCIDAVGSGTSVLVGDLDHPGDVVVERWPGFMEGAAAAGVRAVFAFPLRIGAITVGALDLYCDRPTDLDAEQLKLVLIAADAAAEALLSDGAESQGMVAGGSGSYAGYQPRVHQATGMVQVQLDVSTADAFVMLRARAFSSGRPLDALANDVVERRLRFSTEDR